MAGRPLYNLPNATTVESGDKFLIQQGVSSKQVDSDVLATLYKDHATSYNKNPADGSAHNANDISKNGGGDVQDFIDTNTFKTVADMKAFANHIVGSKVVWQGYYSQSDGGSNWGVVKSGSHTEDGGSVFSINANTYVEANLYGVICVDKFGAGGVADSTPNINALILFLSKKATGAPVRSVGSIRFNRSKTYTILGKLTIVSYLDIDINNSVIFGGDGPLFETGYYNGTNIVSNFGAGNEAHPIFSSAIRKGTIRNSKKAFNLFNFINGSKIDGVNCHDCERVIYAERSFYATYSDILVSSVTTGETFAGIPAIELNDNTNAIKYKGVVITGRDKGLLVRGASFHLEISGASTFEDVTDAITIENESFAVDINNVYFENIHGNAIDMSYPAQSKGTNIDSCFFHNVDGHSIIGQTMIGGCIGDGNVFESVTTLTDVTITGANSSIEVHVPNIGYAPSESALTTMSDKYVLSGGCKVSGRAYVYDGLGRPAIAAIAANTADGSVIDLQMSGNCGYVQGNNVPFCTHVAVGTGGNNFNVAITTRLFYQQQLMSIFAIKISDQFGAHEIIGRFVGLNVYEDSSTGRGITVSVGAGGFAVLTISGFTNAGLAYGIEGVIRMV